MGSVTTPSVPTGRALSARRSNPALGLAAIYFGFGPVGSSSLIAASHDSRCWSRLEPVEYEHPGVEEADV